MPLRSLKRAALCVIGAAAPLLWRRLPGPELLVLTYHRVLPDGHPDRAHEQPGMYVRPETLAMHLEVLGRHFEFVHLDDWLQARDERQPLPRLACALTFDDGWRDNYDHAYPVLRAAHAPATIFLVSAMVGGSYSFWPNRLARQLARKDRALRLEEWPDALRARLVESGLGNGSGRVQPGPEAIDRAIMACKALDDAELHALLDELPPLPEAGQGNRDLLDEREIREMGASGLVRYGSHTRRHTRLRAGLTPEVVRDEIEGSAVEISRIIGRKPELFCYPNGDFTAQAVEQVRGSYKGAASTATGWNGAALDSYAIRRVGVHEDVASRPKGFCARLMRAR